MRSYLSAHRSTIRRICLLVIVCNLLLFAVACSTAWVSTAIGIIEALIPAGASLLGLLGTVGLDPNVLTQFTKWSNDSVAGLKSVQSMITAYQTAAPADQPGILGQIDTGINAMLSGLSSLLPSLRITNPDTQSKVMAMVTEWAGELESLLGLIPVLKGEISDHDEVVRRVMAVKSAKNFKKDFNKLLDAFGPETKALHI